MLLLLNCLVYPQPPGVIITPLKPLKSHWHCQGIGMTIFLNNSCGVVQ